MCITELNTQQFTTTANIKETENNSIYKVTGGPKMGPAFLFVYLMGSYWIRWRAFSLSITP